MDSLIALLVLSALANASIIPRSDPGFQYVPSKATTPDNQFAQGTEKQTGQPPITSDADPDVYGARSVRIAFPLAGQMTYVCLDRYTLHSIELRQPEIISTRRAEQPWKYYRRVCHKSG